MQFMMTCKSNFFTVWFIGFDFSGPLVGICGREDAGIVRQIDTFIDSVELIRVAVHNEFSFALPGTEIERVFFSVPRQ